MTGALRWLLLAPLLLAGAWQAPVRAADVPYLSGRVVDNAEILSPATRDKLTAALKAHEQATGNQIAVLTVPSIAGESIEEYAGRVFATWQLGQKGKDNGVLVVIVPQDRKLRIEVGYGLEGTLTDVASSRIIRNLMTPQFKAGNYDQGTADGVLAVIAQLEGKPGVADAAPAAADTGAARSSFKFDAPDMPWPMRILLGAFMFGIIGLFTFIGIMTPGVGWFLYVFLIPFWAMFPLMIIGMNATFAVFAPLHRRLSDRQAAAGADRVVPEGGAGPEDQGPRERWRVRDDELRRGVRVVVVRKRRRILRWRRELGRRRCFGELVRSARGARANPCKTGSGLLPRQAFGAPAGDGVAVMVVVERPFEAFEHVEDLGKSRLLQCLAGADRALTAAADEEHRAIHAGDLAHLTDEMRIDVPVGTVVPRDVVRADRMADKQIFHFAAAVDEHRLRVLVQEFEGFAGLQMLHSGNSSTAVRTRICRLVRPI